MIVSIQYMRAIAALLVVCTHTAWKGEQYSTNPMHWFNVGGAGVDLFFIISGYIMCHTIYDKKLNIIDFIKARLIRIVPLYWLLTGVALCAYLVAPDKVNSSGGNTSVLCSFILFPTDSKYLIQNGWTLSYEFYFYIIFSVGLLFTGFLRFFTPAVILLSLVSLGYLMEASSVYFNFITNSLLIEFVMGILIFNIHRAVVFNSACSLILIIVSIVSLTCVNFFGGSGERVFDFGVPCFLFFLAMMNFERKFIVLKGNIISSIMAKVGNSSYSIYLIHPFVLTGSSIILKKLGFSEYGWLFVSTLIINSVLVGWCCHVFLEKPITEFIRCLVKRERANKHIQEKIELSLFK